MTISNEIVEKQKKLENLQTRLRENSLETPSNSPNPINDVDERKKLILFFLSNIDEATFGRYVVGLFTDKSNTPWLCMTHRLKCPQWFLDKYYPDLGNDPILAKIFHS